MRKHINSEARFIDVNTGTLVLDTIPTEGSFNAVTSDGVAKAIAQGGGGGGGGGSDVFLAVPNTTTAVEIKAASDAGKEVIINDSGEVYNLVTTSSAPGGTVVHAVFSRTFLSTAPSVSGTSAINSKFYIVETVTTTNVTTWKSQYRYGIPSFNPSTDVGKVIAVREGDGGDAELFWADGIPGYSSSDNGKVLGVVSDGASGYTTGWVSAGGGSGAYIADFRGIGSMTDVQKSALAAAIGAAASAGTPVFAKLDSIQGGNSHIPNARMLPLTDFYYSDFSDFKFHFTAPFDWYDPEDSYAPHRGFNVVEFYNADWVATPYPFSDTFYEASFTAMNPAPHRPE